MTPDSADLCEVVRDQRDCASLSGSSARSDVKQRSMELLFGCAAAAAAAAREVLLLGMNQGGGLHLLLLCWMLSTQPAAHGKCVFILAAGVCALM